MSWTLSAKDGARGQIPYDPPRCTCAHTSLLHVLPEAGGRRGACSASTCDCPKFTAERATHP